MNRATLIGFLAHLKVIMTYGAENAYPFLTLLTAIGVAKLAFGIPAWLAALLMAGAVFGVGLVTFKIGIFSKDLDIKWQKTASARELCERVKRIEEMLLK